MYICSMDISYKGIAGIYKISNSINENIYIGSAVSLYSRYWSHKSLLLNNKHHNKKLQHFVNKYGFENLNFSVIELCNKEDLISIEQKYLDTLKPKFNICKNAQNILGFKWTTKMKKHFSEIRKGKTTTGMLGKKHLPQTIEKIRAKAIKRGLSIKFMEASKKANTGRKHTKEHRDLLAIKQSKISKAQAKEIRAKYKRGIYQKDIAKEYTISQRLVVRVIHGIGIYSTY